MKRFCPERPNLRPEQVPRSGGLAIESGCPTGLPTEDKIILARFALAAFMLLVGLPVLLWFSWMREIPIFWTNEGGYPVWLRAVVLETYYPILLFDFLAILTYFILILRAPPRSVLCLRLDVTILSLMGAAFSFAAIYTVADNILVLLS